MKTFFKSLYAKALEFWRSLPPVVQAVLVVFASTTGTFLGHAASQYLLDPSSACWKWSCVRHTLAAGIAAGIVAAKAFYMRPGPGPQGHQEQFQAK